MTGRHGDNLIDGISTGDGNPLATASASVWDRLIDSIGPASILVVIESRMSAALKRALSPEDIWQDTLLYVWRDRSKCEWRGIKSFRSWVLTVADRRIHDAADRISAQKRGGRTATIEFSAMRVNAGGPSTQTAYPGPPGSTTPSSIAMHAEQAAAMRAALAGLPDALREVVRLRLFDQLTADEVADRLQIGASAVRHRFRKGAALYQQRLVTQLASQSDLRAAESLGADPPKSSPE